MRAGEGVVAWAGRFPAVSPVRELRLLAVLDPGPAGVVSLPWAVLWALSLNEGDLVAAQWEDPAACRLRFQSYAQRVRSAEASCREPWPWVEELLRQPMHALGPGGTLGLEDLAPGEPLVLQAEAGPGDGWFTLERAQGRRPDPELSARASYRLAVEAGFRVLLPADALFALSLDRGAAVGYKTSLWALEGWPADERPGGRRLEVGEGGALPLPEELREYAALKPRSAVRLELRLASGEARFRLEPDLS